MATPVHVPAVSLTAKRLHVLRALSAARRSGKGYPTTTELDTPEARRIAPGKWASAPLRYLQAKGLAVRTRLRRLDPYRWQITASGEAVVAMMSSEAVPAGKGRGREPVKGMTDNG